MEGIKGSSSLKSALVWFLTKTIFTFIDDDSCTVLVGKPGVFIDYRNIVSNDIAIFDQSVLPGANISKQYADVPPKIAIEVDISIDLSELTETGYIYKKNRKLLEFGVEKSSGFSRKHRLYWLPPRSGWRPLNGIKILS